MGPLIGTPNILVHTLWRVEVSEKSMVFTLLKMSPITNGPKLENGSFPCYTYAWKNNNYEE